MQNYNKIVELDTDEDCDPLEPAQKSNEPEPWEVVKMGRPTKSEDRFVKLNLHPYKAGGKQGVYQVCWQLSVMRTKDNHKYIMMYEIDTNEGEVRRMMRELYLFARSDPVPKFGPVWALAKEMAPGHEVEKKGNRGKHLKSCKKILAPITAMEGEGYLLGLKLGGLRRGLQDFRGYEVEGKEFLKDGLIKREDGVDYWLDWADGHPIVGHKVGEMTPSAGVFELFERYKKDVWSKLDPGGAPSLDAVWQAGIKVVRNDKGKLEKHVFLHSRANLVVTTLANNSLKYRNPPLVHWIDLAYFRARYHNGTLWGGQRFGPDGNEHPSLVVISRLLRLQILIYRVWIMPCDWIYREVIRISCFKRAVESMEIISSVLKVKFVNPTPGLNDLIQGKPEDVDELMREEDARFDKLWAKNSDQASDEFYTVRRGAAARAKVKSAEEREVRKQSDKMDSFLRDEFNISMRKTSDGVIAIGTLATENAADIVRFFKKDGLNKIGKFVELYAHMIFSIARLLLAMNGGRPYPVMTEFVMGSYHCFSIPFLLPFESKTPNLPSPSRFDHSSEGSNDPDAHLTGFEAGDELSWDNFERVTKSTFVWDAHFLNQGFMKASPTEMPVMLRNWEGVAQRVVKNHMLVRPVMPEGWEGGIEKLSGMLKGLYGKMLARGMNKIERIKKEKGGKKGGKKKVVAEESDDEDEGDEVEVMEVDEEGGDDDDVVIVG